jgi:hypothetical protein
MQSTGDMENVVSCIIIQKQNCKVFEQKFAFKKVRERAKDTFVLHPHETTAEHEHREENQDFVNWYHHGLYGDKPDFKRVRFNCETWFQISGYLKSQNNRFTMLLHDVKR